ncbi:palladin isoform X2 [Arapaima gigas]
MLSLCCRMQDGSCDQTLPLSLALKDPCPEGGATNLYLDSLVELGEGNEGTFPELSAFLSQEEMDRSLDLAWEAFSSTGDEETPSPEPEQCCPSARLDHTPQPASPADSPAPQSQSGDRFASQRAAVPVYKQERPRLLHGVPLPADRGSASEFCNRAATFIEELSSIFRGSSRTGPCADEDSSSPDSGYLSPKVPATGNAAVAEETKSAEDDAEPEAPPRFTQKLKSQEVSEGSPIRLECRVTGNPPSLVRWFCEGRELHHCPDIQILRDGDLHTLVIAEAFEDDTGRYTCVASNCLGADNTSAEVYIEGASSSDSEGEGSASKSKPGIMPQGQKRTTSVSLTIRSASPRSPEASPHHSALVQTLSQPLPQRVQSPVSSVVLGRGAAPPVFAKMLQDTQAQEGQVVVLECRVRGSPPLQVQWFRESQQIQDSPDFRILQKSEREICTLVIAETFPEDGGLFRCTATNCFGSSSSTARLTVQPVSEDSSANGVSADEGMSFPPPPPPVEMGLLEVPPPPPGTEGLHVNELEMWPSVAALQPVQIIPSHVRVRETPGRWPSCHSSDAQEAPPPQHATDAPPSPPAPTAKNGPPLPTKPKLKPEQLRQLQEQILLEQQIQQQQHLAPPLSPPLPPPPSYQELESSTEAPPLASATTTTDAMQTASTFNYARPKQFIAAQSPAGGAPPSPASSSSSISLRSVPPPFQQSYHKSSDAESPGSPSFPPPPSPFLSPTLSSPTQDFPPPPPPPPAPGPLSPAVSDSPVFSSAPQSPAGFLASVLPSQLPPPPAVNALGLPKGNGTVGIGRKTSRSPRIASDSEIQGSKDAVIQDLERKLRFKEERLSNGQQKLTYEEKMARRLLGADNVATVLNMQEPEEEPVTQEYKVSSFEQRLISEIEFRLERSPVEESDDETTHDEETPSQPVAPFFDQKLKHFKAFEGMPVTFTCKVIGNPKPKVYWFKDGKQISKHSEHYRISREPDGTCSLHTAAALLDDDGNYTIMAGNPEGRTSCTGRMMVQAVNQRGRSHRATPGHIRRPRSRSRDSGEENDNIQERHFRPHFLQAPGDLIVQEGKLCRMDCKVSGLPTPDLIWQLNGQTIRPDSAHKMLVRENGVHSLIIEPVTSRDAGVYTCIASNRAGQNSFNLELIVAAKEIHQAPAFMEKLQNTSVAEGYPVRLECRVSGVPHPQIFWKKENESLTHNTERISMHQDNHGYICMLIQPATKEDAGWYTVSAKNDAGIVSSTARLDVHTQWQQSQTPKPRKVRPSASRYAALTEKGLDVKAAFFPDSSPAHQPRGLVESDDL